jgi:capsular exopolysaccharide synthesis family protein
MKTPQRAYSAPAAVSHPAPDEKHLLDYVRVIYKRRWIAIPAFLIVFVIGSVNALRQTPIFQGRAQLLIEQEAPSVTSLDQMFQSTEGWYNDDFYQTQYRILQSRSLAKRTIGLLNLWDVAKLGNGPEEKAQISVTGLVSTGIAAAISLAKKPFASEEPAPNTPAVTDPAVGETLVQSARIDEFLGGISIVPVRNSRIVEIRYTSSDPKFAAAAANGLAKAYIQQNIELRFNNSKEASDWLAGRLAEQRRAVEASEAALQGYRERNGAVSVTDSASNIVVARLTDLNSALTKAKTERINREAAYSQLKAAEATGAIETVPKILANDYVQKLKSELADLQRQQALLAERYGERHAEMIKIRTAIESADAKFRNEISKVVDSVKNEFQTALSQEQSLQSALDAQKAEALSLNRKGIEFGVLQREAESNRQVYESLLQRTKETDISGDRRTTNIRIVDEAEVPRSPISPNVPREVMMALGGGLFFAFGLAFLFEYLDNRIKTPQELKAHVGVPFLGMVPVIGRSKNDRDPLLTAPNIPSSFAEALKTIRTNVLFSSADEGMRSLVVTSAGPGEGKSVVSSNVAIALAQTGQRVLLIDGDMRRPRIHEIFGGNQEPGLSNVLTGNAKAAEAIRRSPIHGLWLLGSGHIPPNPAELLGSRRFADFMISLDQHFDWVVIDTPPVLVVTDSAIVANQASGVVFVVGADKTSRHAARAAVEQLDSANAHIVGSVLNRVDLIRNPYYYSSYYRKEYAKYYVKNAS